MRAAAAQCDPTFHFDRLSKRSAKVPDRARRSRVARGRGPALNPPWVRHHFLTENPLLKETAGPPRPARLLPVQIGCLTPVFPTQLKCQMFGRDPVPRTAVPRTVDSLSRPRENWL